MPKDDFTGLVQRPTLDRNILLYDNKKFAKTDSQLPFNPDPWASLIPLRLKIDDPNWQSTVYMKMHYYFHKIKYSVLRFFSCYFSSTYSQARSSVPSKMPLIIIPYYYYSKVESVGSCSVQIHFRILACVMSREFTREAVTKFFSFSVEISVFLFLPIYFVVLSSFCFCF